MTVRITIPIEGVSQECLPQLEYALTFASEAITACRINDHVVEAHVRAEKDREEASQKIRELIQRYAQCEFGLPKTVYFKQDRDIPVFDAWNGLLERKWVTPVGIGHVILRGLAAQLMSMIDHKVEREFARHFKAELEIYPNTIKNETLHRCAHFSSFPEHMDFVTHLKQDLDVLNEFSDACRRHGWAPNLHDGRMAKTGFAISPSGCYHCYEGMEGWELEPPGRCTTMTVACHRYEGANLKTLSRLRAFTMREVVFIGQPQFVIDARAEAEARIIRWARDWELGCTFETANDMFFTQDFSVKASFQRFREAKKELRLHVPEERQSLSVCSSNFHATIFGKAFNITVGGRPVTTACIGWGYERWVYAIFSQFGFDVKLWPSRLREELEAHQARGSI